MVHGTPVPQVSEDSAGDSSPRDTTRCVTRYSRHPGPGVAMMFENIYQD